MPITDVEFESILNDESKLIEGDLEWSEDEDHSPSLEFRAEVRTGVGWPLFVKGTYNPLAETLTFALILKTDGRIYGLDLGKDHRNPDFQLVGRKHKHRWTERYRDREAYVPADITCGAGDPVGVWRQFLVESRLRHDGVLRPPQSAVQGELW